MYEKTGYAELKAMLTDLYGKKEDMAKKIKEREAQILKIKDDIKKLSESQKEYQDYEKKIEAEIAKIYAEAPDPRGREDDVRIMQEWDSYDKKAQELKEKGLEGHEKEHEIFSKIKDLAKELDQLEFDLKHELQMGLKKIEANIKSIEAELNSRLGSRK